MRLCIGLMQTIIVCLIVNFIMIACGLDLTTRCIVCGIIGFLASMTIIGGSEE